MVCQRHIALRTTFHERQGIPYQRIAKEASAVFVQDDVSGCSLPEVYNLLSAELELPFNLSTDQPIRGLLLRRSPVEHYLLITIHHIVSDYRSICIFMDELEAAYANEVQGQPLNLMPRDAMAYARYVTWQAEMLNGDRGEVLWQYWKSKLRPDLPRTSLPSRTTANVPRRTWSGASERFDLDPEIASQLRSWAASQRMTVFAVLLSAFQILLHRYTGQQEIVVGSPSLGRTGPELQDVLGYFANPLVFVAEFSGVDTFEEIARRTSADAETGLDHQEYPFASIVERLSPTRNELITPLFQVAFAYERARRGAASSFAGFVTGEEGARADFYNLKLNSVKLPARPCQFDLTLTIADLGDSAFVGSFLYNSAIFESHLVAQMAKHFVQVVKRCLQWPNAPVGNWPVLTTTEMEQKLEHRRELKASITPECIHTQFEQHVSRTPANLAVIAGKQTLSYAELNSRANRLSGHLRDLAIRPEKIVAVLLDRSIDLVVALLAIWKAGGAYVPLDPRDPESRLLTLVRDCGAEIVITNLEDFCHLEESGIAVLNMCTLVTPSSGATCSDTNPEFLAYIMYTSGSTGSPKGVMITHANISNLFAAMDQRLSGYSSETFLSSTNITFDISVLELFWPLTRGKCLVLGIPDAQLLKSNRQRSRQLDFSLFYFSSGAQPADEPYRLVCEGAKFGDKAGFRAVWTPERHFHGFGGLFPNPSVLGAALSAQTTRIGIRGGSVVLPLHNPLRIAEEWAVVDNLSGGRVGVAFASGWHADDFVFVPENYSNRKDVTLKGIATVRRLWNGEMIQARSGSGKLIEVGALPRPKQKEIPVWLTTGGATESFAFAGRLGLNVLTHLIGQSVSDLREKIRVYREGRAQCGKDPETGCVTLMIHTFVGPIGMDVYSIVRQPFRSYLASSIELIGTLAKSLGRPFDPTQISESEKNELLDLACDRYFNQNALFGTASSCLETVEHLQDAGVNELACLIDFGIDTDCVLNGLVHLDALRAQYSKASTSSAPDGPAPAMIHRPLIFQSTPSKAKLLISDLSAQPMLQNVDTWLIGGEPLSKELVEEICNKNYARLLNMYGPTETTIWSMASEVKRDSPITLGNALLNTTVDLMDNYMQLAPEGVLAELFIGGLGVARGYLNRPDLTAGAFLPDPFGHTPGGRVYRTGDLVQQGPKGIEFKGRRDYQVKVRGHRIELGEIEQALRACGAVREAIVLVTEKSHGRDLTAYVLKVSGNTMSTGQIRSMLREKLPDYMIPTDFIFIDDLPLTTSGKIDREFLQTLQPIYASQPAAFVAPRSDLEDSLAQIWTTILNRDRVGMHESFFDLGGHSLMLPEVLSRLRDLGFQEVPLAKLFEHPTISSLAGFLSQKGQAILPTSGIDSRAAQQRKALENSRQRISEKKERPTI